MLIISKDYFSQRFEIECHAINQIETFCLHTLKIHKANWAAVICYIRIYLRRAVYSVCIDLQCDHSLYECLLFSGDCYFMAIHSWQNRNCNRAHFIYGFIDVVKIVIKNRIHSNPRCGNDSLSEKNTRQNMAIWKILFEFFFLVISFEIFNVFFPISSKLLMWHFQNDRLFNVALQSKMLSINFKRLNLFICIKSCIISH